MSSGSYPSLFDVWSQTSTTMFESFMAANRAAAAAMGVPADEGDETSGTDVDDRRADDTPETALEAEADLPGWEVELHTDGDQLSVGDRVRFSKRLTEADVQRFATASGDTNPIHLDQEWAERTRFQGRIVHGILATGLISAALARLPGGVIYLSQDVEFRAPVRLGDRITADVELVEDLGGGRFRLRTEVLEGEETVIDGEAVVLIDDMPE
jgi:acyl dehydratase